MATNMDLLKKIQALEAWKIIASGQIASLQTRVTALESAGTVDLSALEARLTTLENKTCPEQARFQSIEADVAELKADHVPEP